VKLRNLKMSAQLGLGLGAILAMVIALVVLAWLATDFLWAQTSGLYQHPLTVRRAIGQIQADVLAMCVSEKEMFLTDSGLERQAMLQEIDRHEASALRQFDVVYESYLGPRSDVDAAFQAVVEWRAIRDETARLLREGEASTAAARVRSTGVDGVQVDRILGRIDTVSAFALNRGDQFFRDAEEQDNIIKRQLGSFVVFLLFGFLAISYSLISGTRGPLRDLMAVTTQFRQGSMQVRSRYVAANEIGVLAASFNTMADAIEASTLIKDRAARLVRAMFRAEDVRPFCRELLVALLEETGSQSGAVYLLNERKAEFEHFESIGLGGAVRSSFSAANPEGEFGAAVATHQITRVSDIPADTRFVYSTVSGDLLPKEIITIPIVSGREVSAIISLASVRVYSASTIQLIDATLDVLIARMNGVLASQRVIESAARLERQNQELDAQKRELALQADELNERNIELVMQGRQLDEANRLKSAFLSNMSHELRTPLNSVIALSGVLSRRLRGAIREEEYGYLSVIERNGKNLLALINDILDLSRVEAGREEISTSRFSLRDLVVEIVEMLEPESREKGVALLNQVPEGLPAITSDLTKCRHIIQNLVGNAVKFTEQGAVEVSAAQVGQEIHLRVVDTGIGIAADQIPHIFDEFRQADDSASRRYGGTGLGLAIAKKYAQMLRGGISVESALGRGSTFTLRLPLSLESPGAEATASERESSSPVSRQDADLAGRGRSILLVEDSEPAVVQLTDILAGQGYKVRVARNGQEALDQVAVALPDAAILDLMMPGVDGFQVLGAIRGAPRSARLPVLILTAKRVSPEELSFLKGNHIHQLIQKGDISRTGLLAAVAEMVAPPPVPTVARPRRHRHPSRSGPPVILVVENNSDNMRTVRALLEDRYQVVEAADGQEGVEQARRHSPDLILMDIALPVLNGIQALEVIRRDEPLRGVPVIAVTASAMAGDRQEILAHDFDGYISKPIDHEELNEVLREALDGLQD